MTVRMRLTMWQRQLSVPFAAPMVKAQPTVAQRQEMLTLRREGNSLGLVLLCLCLCVCSLQIQDIMWKKGCKLSLRGVGRIVQRLSPLRKVGSGRPIKTSAAMDRRLVRKATTSPRLTRQQLVNELGVTVDFSIQFQFSVSIAHQQVVSVTPPSESRITLEDAEAETTAFKCDQKEAP